MKLLTRTFVFKDRWYTVGLEDLEDQYPEGMDDSIVFYIPEYILRDGKDKDIIKYCIINGGLEE